jgi:flagellar motor switch/type III secretory pathway protein FliN
MNAAALVPFPWKSLEAVPRSNVTALRDLRRWAERHVRFEAFERALADLVGARVEVLVRRATPRAAGPALDGGVALLLAGEDASAGDPGARRGAAVIEVEGAMALAVVARVIRRPLPAVLERDAERATGASGAMAGAFAAIALAAARRAHAGTEAQPASGLRVIEAGAAEEIEARFARGGDDLLALSLTVLVGDDAYAARLVVARDEAVMGPSPGWTARGLAALGATPLSIPVVACAATSTLDELAALREGDAWIPGTWRLERAQGGSLRGDVLLAAPSASTGVRARLVEDGRLVLSGEVDGVCAGDLDDMTESNAGDALLNTIGDVPVVVRVEIGEATLAAREWAALGRGDVVTLGRRVGELVVLRVGGVPVARGELVNVDGEVGVRIAERLVQGPSDAATVK